MDISSSIQVSQLKPSRLQKDPQVLASTNSKISIEPPFKIKNKLKDVHFQKSDSSTTLVDSSTAFSAKDSGEKSLTGVSISKILKYPIKASSSKESFIGSLFPPDIEIGASVAAEPETINANEKLICANELNNSETEKSGVHLKLAPVKPPAKNLNSLGQKKTCAKNGKRTRAANAVLSLETQRLLKVMMRNSKLTYQQQGFLDDLIKDGGALPLSSEEIQRKEHFSSTHFGVPKFTPSPSDLVHDFPPVIRQKYLTGYNRPSMRTLDQISESGAFEADPYRPQPKKNSQHEKRRLQTFMEYDGQLPQSFVNADGTVIPGNVFANMQEFSKHIDEQSNIALQPKEFENIDEFEMIEREIDDRRQWLDDMGKIGKADPYRKQIQGEIAL
ncbi:hypothetical protein HK096_010019, partial [Nowakowskiella sp. JEL0078]